MSSLKHRIHNLLFEQVDASSLVLFRVSFGLIMLIEVYRYFNNGWISKYYIEPSFMFTFYGFGWVQPLAGSGMYWVFVLMGVAALCITIGALYRVAIILFFFVFSYVFLLDMAHYLNHFYLVILLAFLLAVVPVNRTWAVDAWVRPSIRRDTVPGWAVWVFRLQLEVILLYAGLVKLNPDWLRLEPMGMWLAGRADLPIVGQYFTEDWAVAVASYGVIALHLIGAPMLLFRRTRLYAMAIYVVFHLMNVVLFRIGIFPWMTIMAMLLFLEPDWPRRVVRKLGEWQARGIRRGSGDVMVPETSGDRIQYSRFYRSALASAIGVWLAFQVLFPLRHLLYAGYVNWTEEGHKFAWQMMLRDKVADTVFLTRHPATLVVKQVNPHDYMSPRKAEKMAKRPDMILQFAHHLAREAAAQGVEGLQVWARACVSLNGRKEAWLVDPLRDLARVERNLRPADWILPLENPPARPPIRTGRQNLRCRLPPPAAQGP